MRVIRMLKYWKLMLLTIQRNEPSVIMEVRVQRDRRVHQHAEQAEDEADDHGPEAALGVEPLPEHAEEEHDEDRRRQVALDGLQVFVEAVWRP